MRVCGKGDLEHVQVDRVVWYLEPYHYNMSYPYLRVQSIIDEVRLGCCATHPPSSGVDTQEVLAGVGENVEERGIGGPGRELLLLFFAGLCRRSRSAPFRQFPFPCLGGGLSCSLHCAAGWEDA